MPRVAMFEESGYKDRGNRLNAILTKLDRDEFEKARARLRGLYRRIWKVDPAVVSDADTVAYLARGARKAEKYLREKHARKLAGKRK